MSVMAGLLLAWAEISILVNTQIESRGYRAARADLTDTGPGETVILCICDCVVNLKLLPRCYTSVDFIARYCHHYSELWLWFLSTHPGCE